MEILDLLIDLHKRGNRQGPGGDSATEQAMVLAAFDQSNGLRIADLGCGTGASTLYLANALTTAEVVAVDFVPEFIEVLRQRVDANGLNKRVHLNVASIDDLPFSSNEFDAIWSEGAIYNIGFERGVNYWRQFLKPQGVLAVSEITWLTDHRPDEVQYYWKAQYSEMGTASAKIKVLEDAGYSLLGYFVLPEYCWLENYYHPLQSRFDDFLRRHANLDSAQGLVETEMEEMAVFNKFKAYFGYAFYIASKLA